MVGGAQKVRLKRKVPGSQLFFSFVKDLTEQKKEYIYKEFKKFKKLHDHIIRQLEHMKVVRRVISFFIIMKADCFYMTSYKKGGSWSPKIFV